MPCDKWALNFKKQNFENPGKLAIFKSLSQPFASMYRVSQEKHTCLMSHKN